MKRRPRKSLYIFVLALLAASPLGRLLVPKAGSATTPVEKLQDFSLDQVQVTDSYYQNLFTKDINYMMSTLDVDPPPPRTR